MNIKADLKLLAYIMLFIDAILLIPTGMAAYFDEAESLRAFLETDAIINTPAPSYAVGYSIFNIGSANAINRIGIHRGERKPIKIDIEMSGDVGFFQIEEVLLTKIDASPAKQFVELYAGVAGQERKCYL